MDLKVSQNAWKQFERHSSKAASQGEQGGPASVPIYIDRQALCRIAYLMQGVAWQYCDVTAMHCKFFKVHMGEEGEAI